MGLHDKISPSSFRSIWAKTRRAKDDNSGVTSYDPGDFDHLWVITGAEISTVYASTAVTLGTLDTDTVITAIGGSGYSINGGTYTTDAGVINTGDLLRVFLESSASYEMLVEGGVVIGGVDCAFNITTEAEVIGFGPIWDDSGVWDDTLIWTEE